MPSFTGSTAIARNWLKNWPSANIPFSIEGLDVLDTPEVRDVLACLSAAVNPKDAASLFRVAALPQFAIDPAGVESRDDSPCGATNSISPRCLAKLAGGPRCACEAWRKLTAEIEQR